MQHARLRFYAELNDFLRPQQRGQEVVLAFWLGPALKDAIESCGVPHGEVELALVNGISRDFSWRLQDDDRISVYPVFESLDISSLLRLRPAPLRHTRFVVDVNLGRLAAYLRLLGFDTLYRNDFQDAELAAISRVEKRILLTRDIELLKRSVVTHGHFLHATRPREQLMEVVSRLDLRQSCRPLSRCLRCNTVLQAVPKETVADELPPGTRDRVDEFFRCGGCGKLYWRGAHWPRMVALLEAVGVRPE